MPNSTMTRRALLAAIVAAAGGFAAAKRFWPEAASSGADGDFAGRGGGWMSPHWQRLDVRGGGPIVSLPVGWRGTAPDQPVPVFVQDREFTTGEIEISFRVTGAALRAGVLFGAKAPFTFAGVTVEGESLVLADYEREERRVLASVSVPPLVERRKHRLRVEIGARRTRAAFWLADAAEPDWQLTAAHRARPGGPGILLVAPPNRAEAELEVTSFDLRSATGFAETPPSSPVILTGTPAAEADGGYSARVTVWSAWPASVVFERSDSRGFGSADEIATVPVDEPPFVAHARIVTDGTRPVYWRARVHSHTSARETITPVHLLRPPPAERPLVLIAASCVQLVGAAPNRGFARLMEAAPEPPALLVFQGDLGYAANFKNAAYARAPDFFADRFQRTLARPDFVLLRRDVPVGFTLDDHDYGPPNNAHRRSVGRWAIQLWNRLHADPSERGYFDTRFGDVHCLVLDVRRYADPARQRNRPGKTRLGHEQYAWLEQTIHESDARLFVVFSAGTFARRWDPDSGKPVRDTFIYGWTEEYRRIMKLFSDVQAQGRRVLILSGDAHGMRIHRHPDPLSGMAPAPWEIVEFICSGLRTSVWSAAPPGDPTVDPARAVVGRPGAGMVVIDPASAAPRRVTLRAVGADDSGPRDLFPPLLLPFAPAAY